jgi:hypothetical protein
MHALMNADEKTFTALFSLDLRLSARAKHVFVSMSLNFFRNSK